MVSGFRHRRQTELERRLRAERPVPRDELVRMLAGRPKPGGSRGLVPRLALVGALTAVMLAALAAVGGAAQARSAFDAFGGTIHDVVFVPWHGTGDGRSQNRTPQGHQEDGGKGKDGGNDHGNGGYGGGGGNSGGGNSGGGGNDHGNGGNDHGDDGDHGDDDHPGDGYPPWQHQYHHKWPICHRGQTLYVSLPGFIFHLLHGDHPGRCRS